MAKVYATTRMARHQASAIQMFVLTGCCANRSRIVLTMDVTGWLSAKARTGPGMVWVGTNAELMNGRKTIGYEKAPAPSTVFADSPAMTAPRSASAVPRLRGHWGAVASAPA